MSIAGIPIEFIIAFIVVYIFVFFLVLWIRSNYGKEEVKSIRYILKPDFFDDDCIRFYQNHYWLWCLRMRRLKCLFGFHKWIDCSNDIGAYCDNCPMEKNVDGTTHLMDVGK